MDMDFENLADYERDKALDPYIANLDRRKLCKLCEDVGKTDDDVDELINLIKGAVLLAMEKPAAPSYVRDKLGDLSKAILSLQENLHDLQSSKDSEFGYFYSALEESPESKAWEILRRKSEQKAVELYHSNPSEYDKGSSNLLVAYDGRGHNV